MKLKKRGLWLLGGMAVLLLAGCSSMGMVEVKHKDASGREVTTWTDPENAKRLKAQDEAREARAEGYRQAEKRKAGEPIRVALFDFTYAENLKKGIDRKKLFETFRKAFEGDPVIRLVDQGVVNRAQAEAQKSRPGHGESLPQVDADISVFPHALADTAYGISKSTGKAASMPVLVFKAEVMSHYLAEDQVEVQDKENIFRNLELTKRFADKIKTAIKKQIGPRLPSLAYVEGQKDQQKEDMKKALQKLFGGGKKDQ